MKISDENKSHYVYTEDLNRFMCMGQIIKRRNTFADIVYNVLVVKKSCENIKKFVWR